MGFHLHIAGVGAVGAAEVFTFGDFFVDDKFTSLALSRSRQKTVAAPGSTPIFSLKSSAEANETLDIPKDFENSFVTKDLSSGIKYGILITHEPGFYLLICP